jgi:hypothetical protein
VTIYDPSQSLTEEHVQSLKDENLKVVFRSVLVNSEEVVRKDRSDLIVFCMENGTSLESIKEHIKIFPLLDDYFPIVILFDHRKNLLGKALADYFAYHFVIGSPHSFDIQFLIRVKEIFMKANSVAEDKKAEKFWKKVKKEMPEVEESSKDFLYVREKRLPLYDPSSWVVYSSDIEVFWLTEMDLTFRSSRKHNVNSVIGIALDGLNLNVVVLTQRKSNISDKPNEYHCSIFGLTEEAKMLIRRYINKLIHLESVRS